MFDDVAAAVDLPVECRRPASVAAPVVAVSLLVVFCGMVHAMPRLRR
ncbi:hypothetical protein [Streptomyces sp. NPDC088254]